MSALTREEAVEALVRELPQLLQDRPELRFVLAGALSETFAKQSDLGQILVEIRVLREDSNARFAEHSRRLEERGVGLEAAVTALAEAQRRTEQRVEELAEAQLRTEQRIEDLAEAQRQTADQMRRVVDLLQWLTNRVSDLTGKALEMRYLHRIPAYFGPWLKRAKEAPMADLLDDLDERLGPEDFDDVALVDLIVQGVPRDHPEIGDVLLAVEISWVVDEHDVERAERRARLLRKASYQAIPIVAGETATDRALSLARRENVAVLQDGKRCNWEEALQVCAAEHSDAKPR